METFLYGGFPLSCSACGREKVVAKGLCNACYQLARKYGTPTKIKVRKQCTIEGCGRPAVSGGLCDLHRKRRDRHGHTEQTRPADWGLREASPLYKSWCDMKSRCENPKNTEYVNYGARGITVCDRWADLWAFVDDMSPKPSDDHTLDRIDVNAGYSPENCRWATRSEQCRNQRKTVLTEDLAAEIKRRSANGEMCGDIGRSLGVSYELTYSVITGRSWKD